MRSGWAALGIVMVLVGTWYVTGRESSPPANGGAQVVAGSLDDLLMELQLLPLESQTPKPFALTSLDGRRVALADFAGRPALLYFWATW